MFTLWDIINKPDQYVYSKYLTIFKALNDPNNIQYLYFL